MIDLKKFQIDYEDKKQRYMICNSVAVQAFDAYRSAKREEQVAMEEMKHASDALQSAAFEITT